jgi:hypothetical protein
MFLVRSYRAPICGGIFIPAQRSLALARAGLLLARSFGADIEKISQKDGIYRSKQRKAPKRRDIILPCIMFNTNPRKFV